MIEAECRSRVEPRRSIISTDASTNTSFITFAPLTEIVDVPVLVNIPKMLRDASAEIRKQIERDLTDALDEVADLTDRQRLERARPSCGELVRSMSGSLALEPRAAIAAFADEEDGVSVVAQSFATSRRVTVSFGSGDGRLHVIKVDEDHHIDRSDPNGSLETLGEELARWLIARR